ncbi:hypothetical protein CapIbe_015471 [Capra ibex]
MGQAQEKTSLRYFSFVTPRYGHQRAAELLHSPEPPQGCPPPSHLAAPTAQQPLTLTNLLRPRSSPLSQFPTLDSVSRSSQPGPPEGQTPLRVSVTFRNVTQRDTGPYTQLVTKNNLQTEIQTGRLHVHPVLPTPVITSNNSNAWEHEDTVVLTCGSETQNTSYMWWINSQSLPKSTRLELSKDKRTLTVVTLTRNDTGPYVCEARNPVSVSRSDPFTLDVLSPVAQPPSKPATPVTEHKGPVALTCLAYETGVSIRWFFKGQSLLLAERMTLSSDNSTLTIDPVSREDTGDYQCEAFNRGNSNRSDPLRLRVTCE